MNGCKLLKKNVSFKATLEKAAKIHHRCHIVYIASWVFITHAHAIRTLGCARRKIIPSHLKRESLFTKKITQAMC